MTRTLFKSFVGNWSLERKCLLFIGLALVASLLLAFFAVQVVAERLVMETARQSARDYANSFIGWKHIYSLGRTDTGSPPTNLLETSTSFETETSQTQVLELLRKFMLQSQFECSILRLEDDLEHEFLQASVATGSDLPRLNKIHAKLAERDSIALEQAATPTGIVPPATPDTPATDPKITAPITAPITSFAPPSTHIFEEAGPFDGYYYYYHPIEFSKTCLECHAKLPSSTNTLASTSVDPFRVIRIKMPNSYTQFWSLWSYSLLTSIAICTLALSLFFVHWILKRLVIRPLVYMKQVSEQITAGDTALRFQLDTDDEFHDLSESFNAMLRHLTNIQSELRSVNDRINQQVDELARVNLELFEANRLKGEFLANMSHELRTPLNSILGFSDVLHGFESLTEKQRRYVSNIQHSGRNLLEMINDILDLAKVEAGKMQVRPVEFDLLQIIHSQCDIIRKMADDKNIDLRVDSSQTAMLIEQDQGKVQQILTNLLSNAIKFTPEGGLITVSCEYRGDDEVLISVADTGVGIAIEDHEIIFEKFRQAKGVTGNDGLTREHSGTGLGLSIVRELCRLLGGDIGLSSQIGFGSTFRVKLPIRYVKLEESAT